MGRTTAQFIEGIRAQRAAPETSSQDGSLIDRPKPEPDSHNLLAQRQMESGRVSGFSQKSADSKFAAYVVSLMGKVIPCMKPRERGLLHELVFRRNKFAAMTKMRRMLRMTKC
jgi:hypothetical protein